MNNVTKSIAGNILFLLISTGYGIAAYAQISTLPNGFPSNDAEDGTLLVASQGLSSLGAPPVDGTVFNVHIRVLLGQGTLNIEIFDPDLHSDQNDPNTPNAFWDFPPLNKPGPNFLTSYDEQTRFELYPDVDISGNTDAGDLIVAMVADSSMDNQWVDLSGGGGFVVDTTDPKACEQGSGAEFCFYHLLARWIDPGTGDPKMNATTLGGNVLNGFIVASDGLPFLAAGSTIGIMGMTDAQPNFPVPPTNYDGSFALRALVTDPDGVCSLDVYDGDADRFGNAVASDEDDDPNTPGDGVATGFFPFNLSSDTVEEGVNPGAPKDNNPDDPALSIGLPIFYTVSPEPPTAAYGVLDCCVNTNPSGDKEWEIFRIASTAAGCPAVNDPGYDPDAGGPAPATPPDRIVSFIGPGFHTVSLSGMDQNNLNFLNVSADVFAAEVFEFGDAPDSYMTLIASGGPQHGVDSRLRLGINLDAEFDGMPGAAADGDDTSVQDDEDGVSSFSSLDTSMAGTGYNVDVVVDNELDPGNQATVYGWIDFDGNGVFDADESTTAPVDPGDTMETLAFVVPVDVVAGDTYGRFRISTEALAGPGGEASDGEVEDYTLTIDPFIPPGGGQGCTPGYWKQQHHFDSWMVYSPGDSYQVVFDVTGYNKTLLQALAKGGGGKEALGRHSVAALLNSVNDDVSYAFNSTQVIQIVQDAYSVGTKSAYNTAKDMLANENEKGCPLNNSNSVKDNKAHKRRNR